MKKIYESPAFFAEAYSFSDSIAKCEYHIDQNSVVPITIGQNVCGANDHNGHKYGGQQGNSGNIAVNDTSNQFTTLTLFNDLHDVGDNVDHSRCQFDWDYSTNTVYGPDGTNYGTFAAAFYGNESNVDRHGPGYKGSAFYS